MITTESSNANALRMAKLLIQHKLAACVSIKQIFSIYKWDDDIAETKEFEITIKSKLEFKDCLIDFVNNSRISTDVIRENINNNILEQLLTQLVSISLIDLEINELNLSISDGALAKKIKNQKR